MVDRLVDINEKGGITELTILQDNIFVDDGEFSSAGILENMAQSCAARIGYINCTKGGVVKNGVIGDIRNFTVLRNPLCNENIRTYITIEEEVFNITLATLETKVDDEVIASATIKIALIEPNQ